MVHQQPVSYAKRSFVAYCILACIIMDPSSESGVYACLSDCYESTVILITEYS